MTSLWNGFLAVDDIKYKFAKKNWLKYIVGQFKTIHSVRSSNMEIVFNLYVLM